MSYNWWKYGSPNIDFDSVTKQYVDKQHIDNQERDRNNIKKNIIDIFKNDPDMMNEIISEFRKEKINKIRNK